MIKHHFSLICKHAVIDEKTKSLSIFDVIEQINVFADPDQTVQIPMRFDLISLWMKSDLNTPARGISRISLQDPKGITKNKYEVDIELTESTFFRSIISFSGIELRGSGLYNFLIEMKQNDDDWKNMAEIPFIVTYEPPKKSN